MKLLEMNCDGCMAGRIFFVNVEYAEKYNHLICPFCEQEVSVKESRE